MPLYTEISSLDKTYQPILLTQSAMQVNFAQESPLPFKKTCIFAV